MTDRRRSAARGRMADVSHTHRTDPRNVFAELFRRGATALADGGRERSGSRSDEGRIVDAEEMEDVDHEAPDEEGATGVWERGRGPGEGPEPGDEDVDGDG